MRHQDLTANHILESWVYANAAARSAATGFVTADIGRIAFQTDTGQYWRLIATTPAWQLITGGAPGSNVSQTTPANPTGTASTTGVMMGLAIPFTPIGSGKIMVAMTGSMANNAAGGGAKPQIRWGTGTPPASAAGPVGTASGNLPQLVNLSSTASLRVPFAVNASITGLTPGTPIWIDLSLAAISTGTANVYDLCATINEL